MVSEIVLTITTAALLMGVVGLYVGYYRPSEKLDELRDRDEDGDQIGGVL